MITVLVHCRSKIFVNLKFEFKNNVKFAGKINARFAYNTERHSVAHIPNLNLFDRLEFHNYLIIIALTA